MTLIKVTQPRKRIIELESEGAFAAVMQQADSGPGDQRRRLEGAVYVSHDRVKWEKWLIVFNEIWCPEFEGGLPRFTEDDLREIARPSGYRYAEFRWATTLEYRQRSHPRR